jgi:hypothetical protein
MSFDIDTVARLLVDTMSIDIDMSGYEEGHMDGVIAARVVLARRPSGWPTLEDSGWSGSRRRRLQPAVCCCGSSTCRRIPVGPAGSVVGQLAKTTGCRAMAKGYCLGVYRSVSDQAGYIDAGAADQTPTLGIVSAQ